MNVTARLFTKYFRLFWIIRFFLDLNYQEPDLYYLNRTQEKGWAPAPLVSDSPMHSLAASFAARIPFSGRSGQWVDPWCARTTGPGNLRRFWSAPRNKFFHDFTAVDREKNQWWGCWLLILWFLVCRIRILPVITDTIIKWFLCWENI